MRLGLIIMAILFYGCYSKQEPKSITNLVSVIKMTENKSKFDLTSNTTCDQINLSNQFDLSINLENYTNIIELQDSGSLIVFIKDKKSKLILDSIFLTSRYFGYIQFICDSMTSFSTKYNSNKQAVDNYYGDIVVADLNFDSKDDIAVINDCGGNGGPLYSFFIQTNENKFILDIFLTDSVTYFPYEIDKINHRLVTNVHAGACCIGEHIYHLDKTTNKWKQTSHEILRQ